MTIHIVNSKASGAPGALVLGLAAVVLAGCTAGGGTVVIDPGPVVIHPQGVLLAPLDIPEGHLPPPGSCRIWFPELPAGQQPPPADCQELRYRVPPGAYLIRG